MRSVCIALTGCLLAAACAPEDDGVILMVHGNLPAEAGVTRVETVVFARDGGVHGSVWHELEYAARGDPDASAMQPAPFGVLIEKNRSDQAWVAVRGYGARDASEPLVSYTLRATMRTGALDVLEAPLGAVCVGRPCPSDQTCYPRAVGGTAAGACGPVLSLATEPYQARISAADYAASYAQLAEPLDLPPSDAGTEPTVRDTPLRPPERACDRGACITVANQGRLFAMNQLAGTRIVLPSRRKIVALGMFVDLQPLLEFQTVDAQATRVRMALYGQFQSGTPSQLLGETDPVKTVDALPLGTSAPLYATQGELTEPVHAGPGELWLFFAAPGHLLVQGHGSPSQWLVGPPGGLRRDQPFPKYPDQQTTLVDALDTTFSPFTAAVYVVTVEPTEEQTGE